MREEIYGVGIFLYASIMQKLAQLKKEAESEKLINEINESCLISEVTLF